MANAVVLLSGGLDSTFNLFKARQSHTIKLALTFDYGQKAAQKEIRASAAFAKILNVPHRVVSLPWFRDFTSTALVASTDVPVGNEVQIDSLQRSLETAKAVWVPNRNGIFLNIAAGFAEGLKAEVVIPGFNYEEAMTFPDNSMAYLKALDEAWSFSTESRVKTECFSGALNKTQIVREALALSLPLSELWPCYLDEESWCGKCESCLRFKRAVTANGLSFTELQGREV